MQTVTIRENDKIGINATDVKNILLETKKNIS